MNAVVVCKSSSKAKASSNPVDHVQAQGFINEAHHPPDCGLAFPLWQVQADTVLPSTHTGIAGIPAGSNGDREHSLGYILAKSIWEEVLLAANYRRKRWVPITHISDSTFPPGVVTKQDLMQDRMQGLG